MVDKEELVVDNENLKNQFIVNFQNLLDSGRITRNSFALFKDTLKDCECILSKDENLLFAKNGMTIKRFISIFNNINACIVFILLSAGKYNSKELEENINLLPKSHTKSQPNSIVHHWLNVFRDLRIVKRSEYSIGKENIYEYSEKYPLIVSILEKHSKNKYRSSLSKSDLERLPPFINDFFVK